MQNQSSKKKYKPLPKKFRIREAINVLCVCLGFFLLISFLTFNKSDPSWSNTSFLYNVENSTGVLGAFLSDFILYLFGAFGYLIPVCLILLPFLNGVNYEVGYTQVFGLILSVLSICGMFSLMFTNQVIWLPFYYGGVIGEFVSMNMQYLFNFIGAQIVLLGIGLAGVVLFSGLSVSYIYGLGKDFSQRLYQVILKLIHILKSRFAPKNILNENKRLDSDYENYPNGKIENKSNFKLFTENFIVNKFLKKDDKDISSEDKDTPNKKEDENKVDDNFTNKFENNFDIIENEQDKLSSVKNKNNNFDFFESDTSTDKVDILNKIPTQEYSDNQLKDDDTAFKSKLYDEIDVNQNDMIDSNLLSENEIVETKKSVDKLPSINFLKPIVNNVTNKFSEEEFAFMASLIQEKLKDFGIDVSINSYLTGPVVTRFELDLAPGLKASKITSLSKDLARSLSQTSVRIVEVIPGKSCVGLEVPNPKREIVSLYDVFNSNEFKNSTAKLGIALGKDISGKPIIADIAKMPHLLVAGTTGSGKSVGVNTMLLSLLYRYSYEDVKFILVDPKMLELSVYEGIPHLLTPVVTDMKEAASALKWCVAEMERRYQLMSEFGVRNIAGFNQVIKNKSEKLPYIVIVIDEFADMIMVVGKKVEQLIARIAQKARAAGIHMILATQRPSVDVITGLIKSNIPTRLSFQVSSRIDSRTILDQQGAENLLGNGDLLFLPPGLGAPLRVHGAFVSDEEVNAVTNYLRTVAKPNYIENISISSSLDDNKDVDELYQDALEFVREAQKVSISSIQRKFRIGYNRAASIVDTMEESGVVSPMESNGQRELL